MNRWHVFVETLARSFYADTEHSLLDCARSEKCPLPGACQNGNCDICECVLKAGTAADQHKPDHIYYPGDTFLACRSRACSDLVIRPNYAAFCKQNKKVSCQIISQQSAQDTAIYIKLHLAAGRNPPWHSGQFALLSNQKQTLITTIVAPEASSFDARQLSVALPKRFDKRLQQMRLQANISISYPLGADINLSADKPTLFITQEDYLIFSQALLHYHDNHGQCPPHRLWLLASKWVPKNQPAALQSITNAQLIEKLDNEHNSWQTIVVLASHHTIARIQHWQQQHSSNIEMIYLNPRQLRYATEELL
jgi:ferredoxin